MRIRDRDIAALANRKLTKTALATRLGVSPSYLSRNTPRLPPGPVVEKRKQQSKLAATRKAFRLKLAQQVLDERRSLESAAKEAHCSTRTIYRYLCRLRK